MPEGPEIHRAATELSRTIEGERAREVFFAFARLKKYENRLSGQCVRGVEARGKAILTRFESGLTVFSHNQLYRKWFVGPLGELPQTKRQLRFAVHTRKHSALLYSASDIEVLDERGIERHRYLCRLGLDPLSPDVGIADVLSRVSDARFGRRQLGHLLLDQAFLAGVGNYLRSEILFEARLHPSRRPVELDSVELRRMARAAISLSRRSFRTGGITNDPGRVSRLRRAGARRSDYRFLVYGRGSEPCYVCSRGISRTTVGSRSIYLCSSCQNPDGSAR